jgi:hypothetical protein
VPIHAIEDTTGGFTPHSSTSTTSRSARVAPGQSRELLYQTGRWVGRGPRSSTRWRRPTQAGPAAAAARAAARGSAARGSCSAYERRWPGGGGAGRHDGGGAGCRGVEALGATMVEALGAAVWRRWRHGVERWASRYGGAGATVWSARRRSVEVLGATAWRRWAPRSGGTRRHCGGGAERHSTRRRPAGGAARGGDALAIARRCECPGGTASSTAARVRSSQ